MEKKIDSIKKEVYNLFGSDTTKRRYFYVRRNWIFPNHFDIMLDLVKDMCQKYDGDEAVCRIAVLLHDVGLVYKRESASPEGHEERSIEYAKNILGKYKISEEMQKEIIECIKATDISGKFLSVDAKIVRTADALSQFIGVHFFAKAAFSGDWKSYYSWLRKKVINNFEKICFEDERKQAEPIKKYILDALNMYEKNNGRYFK